MLSEFYSKIDGDNEAPLLEEINNVITQYVELDPSSTAFRYPKRLDGTKSLSDIQHINVLQFYEVFEKAADLLDSASACIGIYLNIKADMISDMRE